MDTADYLANFSNVTAESLAAQAGLLAEGNRADTVNTKGALLKTLLGALQSKSHAEQIKIHHEFAAKYLPAVAEKYKESSDALNSSLRLMNLVGHTPYFVRFSRTPAGQGIAALQVTRMLDVSSDTTDVDSVGEICQFLSTALVLQGLSDVDVDDKNALVRILKQWETLYNGKFAAETSDRCLSLLTDDPESRGMIQTVKHSLERSLEECGGQGCSRRQQPNGSKLMVCSRCKTAVYCGTDHQKKSWPTHKSICFAAAF